MAVRQQARLFQVAAEELPAPLPSLEEVFACDDIIVTRQGACDISCEVTIVKVSDFYEARFGTGVNMAEVENMIFVAENTSIRIPKVYSAYTYGEKHDSTIMIVEFVEGLLLADFAYHPRRYLRSIRERLCAQIAELRQIPNPNIVRFGALGNRGYPSFCPHMPAVGPFDTSVDAAVNLLFPLLPRHGNTFAELQSMFSALYGAMIAGDERWAPVFSNGALNGEGIVIEADGTPVILDWQFAGFYPAFYEQYRADALIKHWLEFSLATPSYLCESRLADLFLEKWLDTEEDADAEEDYGMVRNAMESGIPFENDKDREE
ncbi:hypothetical protein GGR50DRAFT_628460 [Xylaria sp. CBS 124048]|nr:hypothetical protein GGR50DRAFT_628460 [Xylaria sp. CBS 124048]